MKRITYIVIAMLMLTSLIVVADVKDGQYNVKVCLMKAYEDDYSMGNDAMLADGVVLVKNGKAKLRVTFVPLKARGFRGYLGELYVNNKLAKVLETYDEVDGYNDAVNGIDERMKGKMYPKLLEVPLDLTSDIVNCVVYVPVMGELGVGEQPARIKITYPETLQANLKKSSKVIEQSESKQKQVEKQGSLQPDLLDKAKSTNGKVKYYSVPINLWHAVEDRASMGNNAMLDTANIKLENGKMTLYVGSKQMTVSTITASLINLYYDNGKEYIKAKPHSFAMKVKGFDELRPEVFTMPLNKKTQFLNVMVDPKVEPMGDDPIKARFKFDFAKIKEISKQQATLILKAETGRKKRAYDSSVSTVKSDKGVSIKLAPETFADDYTFYANLVHGEKLADIKKSFGKLAMLDVYELTALANMEKIPYDVKPPINSLRESYQPKKSVEIYLPLSSKNEVAKVVQLGSSKQELKFTKLGNKIMIKSAKLGKFAVVYQNKQSAVVKIDGQTTPQSNNSQLTMTGAETSSSEMINRTVVIIIGLVLVLIIMLGSFLTVKLYGKLSDELHYAEVLQSKLRSKESK